METATTSKASSSDPCPLARPCPKVPSRGYGTPTDHPLRSPDSKPSSKIPRISGTCITTQWIAPAAWLAALYPNLVAYSHYLWSETLFVFWLLAGTFLVTRARSERSLTRSTKMTVPRTSGSGTTSTSAAKIA